jgi:hypothetical protein
LVVPVILRVGSYRFFFYSNENAEPAHIHVQKDSALAKFWLKPAALASSSGFPAHELTRLMQIVRERENRFLEAWNEFFGASN